MNKFVGDRPYSDPEAAARKLVEIANSVEAVQDGRIYIELINGPFLFELKGTPAEYSAGLDRSIERGWAREFANPIALPGGGMLVKTPATTS
jgi:hypothetical protein